MRRRSGSDHWFRGDDGPEKMLGPAGEDIVRGFELHDFLESVSDDQRLLQQRLRVSPRVRLQQEFEPTADGWSVAESRLQLKQGLAYSGTIDPYMARLIMQCDGKRRLAELVTELAAALQRDFTNVASICLDVIRRLIERGLLLPEQDDR